MNLNSRIKSKLSRTVKSLSQLSKSRHNQNLRIRIEEVRQSREKYLYKENPRLTLIVQSFNKRHNIKKLIERLRLTSAEELIVIDDGSSDGSFEDWIQCLDQPNDFLLHCNDLFEVRTYDRAIRMAKGEFVCLLQDDDFPQANNLWIQQAMRLFEAFPKLLILGGRDGMDTLMPDFNEPPDPNAYYERVENICEWKGVHKIRLYWEPDYVEPKSNIPFRFTAVVNRAPTFLRRKEFIEIGGINQNYAPFQLDDDDACIRAWLKGYQVGFYQAAFMRGFDVGGMSLFNSERRKDQVLKNAKQLYIEHGRVIADGSLQNLVDSANYTLLPKN